MLIFHFRNILSANENVRIRAQIRTMSICKVTKRKKKEWMNHVIIKTLVKV